MSELAGLADALGALAEDEENVTVLTDVDVVLLRSAATALRRAARVEEAARAFRGAIGSLHAAPPNVVRTGESLRAALEADR